MKIALACQSVLLEKSLEIFLRNYIVSYKKSDFVISDQQIEIDKPVFYISPNGDGELDLPFTKSALILSIEKFYAQNILDAKKPKSEKSIDLDSLEKEITKLTDTFRQDLIAVIKERF